MNIGILGTGNVGRAIGSHLIQRKHKVKLGSRTTNNEKAIRWTKENGSHASHGTFSDAASFGEIIFNCTLGMSSLEALRQAGKSHLDGKILVDVSNPLDFSKGMPPSLSVCNTDSLGERIQQAFPELKVVKTLNTMNSKIMVNPSMIKGKHCVFVSGNDESAKRIVKDMLKADFDWKEIIDLGDISTCRGTEMLLPLWLRVNDKLGSAEFNFSIVH
ncbi:MAG: NADP oxidoreductase [Bacteroidetes bacterium]|nr:MAG: NADP oxidoreductase [Bacteroidota bacterium]REK05262.1 MAG: NADP oxidoreductase [Bacteroidota bacterium]REK32667.1 MAG: NADP oxidoreductase [Bacteroidota bacterium]REK48886.1 MAG: NADP oxidoreductase [Bacteroidota bacterium]